MIYRQLSYGLVILGFVIRVRWGQAGQGSDSGHRYWNFHADHWLSALWGFGSSEGGK